MNKIILTSKTDLDIYMSPMRQRLLRELSISKAPMTAKMLADKLQISASGVQHHIRKLVLLGLVELDHTEVINGIIASYFKLAQVTVQIGLSQSDDVEEQKEVLLQNLISQVYDGFRKRMKSRLRVRGSKDLHKWGDILSGIVYLGKQESEQLLKLIADFVEQHSSPDSEGCPWEYALILYNAEENGNE